MPQDLVPGCKVQRQRQSVPRLHHMLLSSPRPLMILGPRSDGSLPSCSGVTTTTQPQHVEQHKTPHQLPPWGSTFPLQTGRLLQEHSLTNPRGAWLTLHQRLASPRTQEIHLDQRPSQVSELASRHLCRPGAHRQPWYLGGGAEAPCR